MTAKKGKKNISTTGKFVAQGTQHSSGQKTVIVIPSASSCSAFNYYANNAEEREEASARYRADVSKKKRSK